MWRSVRDRALAKPTDRRADGVKAVSRRRRGRVAPALSPGRSRVYFYTVASRGPGFLAPVARELLHELGASVGAPEPHDFAVRGQLIRLVRCRVHRIPRPTSVTTAKRPSFRCGTGFALLLFLANEKAKNFLKKDWTGREISAAASSQRPHRHTRGSTRASIVFGKAVISSGDECGSSRIKSDQVGGHTPCRGGRTLTASESS